MYDASIGSIPLYAAQVYRTLPAAAGCVQRVDSIADPDARARNPRLQGVRPERSSETSTDQSAYKRATEAPRTVEGSALAVTT